MRYIIFYLLWATVSMLGSQLVVYWPLHWILGSNLSHPFWNSTYAILSYGLGLFLCLFIPQKFFKQKITRESMGLKGLPKWADLALAPIGFVVYTFAATVLTGLFSKFPFFNSAETQNLGYNSLYFAGDKVFAFFALCLVAPIAEELIFRGWLYAKLRAKIKHYSLFLSIFLTSLLFAILHGQWNVGVNVFCLSVVLCLLREVTGTVYSGIILHILKNTLAFVLVFMIS